MTIQIGDTLISPDKITEFQVYNSDTDRFWCEWSDKRGTFWILKEALENDVKDGLYKIKE